MPRSDDPSDDPSLLADSEIADRRILRDVDTLFECLADRRRRLLVELMSENPGAVAVEAVVRHISEREGGAAPDVRSNDTPVEIVIALHHNHLPRMDEAGVIEVDREANTVREGDRFDAATSLLEVV